jgi:chromate transporter
VCMDLCKAETVSTAITLQLHWQDWLNLFLHYLSLSLLSFGGALATAPEMHRYLVEKNSYLNEAQFNSSIAIAQTAPGPNILFVALMGWNVGMNAGGMQWASLGLFLTMSGILLPSTILTYNAARWGQRNRDLRIVRAFKQGMAPLIIAMLLGTGWVMASVHNQFLRDWPLWLVTIVTAILVWRTRIHLLLLLAAGAGLGWFGWI